MSKTGLEGEIAALGQELLLPAGFTQEGRLCFERQLAGLTQGIEFLRGTGSKKGRFTVNLYWRFTHSPLVKEDAMDFWQRLGVFLGGADEWYRSSQEHLQETFSRFSDVFRGKVLLFFDRFDSIEAILTAYEQSELEEQVLFGVDAGWREYNIGYSYLFAGSHPKAAKHLRRVVDQFSTGGADWVQARRRQVESTLAEIVT